MDTYNQLLDIVLKSFGIDIESISVDEAVELLLEEAVIDDHVDVAVKKCLEKIKTLKETNPRRYEEIIMCLVKDYISKEPKNDTALIKLLNISTKEEIINCFSEDPSFGNSLVTYFVFNLFVSDNKIVENFDNLNLLHKFSNNLVFEYLGDVIRKALARINSYFSSTSDAYEFIETILYNNVYVSDTRLQKAIIVIKCYQGLVMRLVYADVYEFLLTLDNNNPEITRLKTYIESYIQEKNYFLDPRFNMENEELFKYFFSLNNARRAINHQSIAKHEKGVLRSIYPLYMIDSSGIIKK